MHHTTANGPQNRRTRLRRSVIGVGVLLVATVVTATATPATGSASRAPIAAPAASVAPMRGPLLAAVLPNVDICATTGTVALPNATPAGGPDSITVWGYVAGDCTGTSGSATLDSAPVIPATVGDTVNVTLHNDLGEDTSLTFRGQPIPTDIVGVPAGGSKLYTFDVSEPGTFLYGPGTLANTQHQSAMGLAGVLEVLPVGGVTQDADEVVLVRDIDPALNNAADPAMFDMRDFAPKFDVLNGAVFPQTAGLGPVAPGDDVLLRYLNAGVDYRSMGVLGASQRVISDDGHPLDQSYSVVALTVGPGQTFDAVVHVSDTALDGSQIPVYDAGLQLRNRLRRPANPTYRTYGGALAFLDVAGVGAGAGPLVTDVVATTTSTTALASDASTGGQTIQTVEYFVDTPGAPGTGTTMIATDPDGTFDDVDEPVEATYDQLSDGQHTVYLRAQDADGNWGPITSQIVSVGDVPDDMGPVTSGVLTVPAATNGSVSVDLQATASDATTGGHDVVAAEYFVGSAGADGSGMPMTVNNQAVTASLDATIAAADVDALADGVHSIYVHAQDELLNWGDVASFDLTIDRVEPTIDALTATPNPTNGLVGINAGTNVLRVTGSVSDDGSGPKAAEGFIDTVGALGSGFVFQPSDGTWNTSDEDIQSDIPLATIRQLSDGPHTIFVRARDAAGNWTTTPSEVVLLVDKTGPVVSAVTAVPNPSDATTSVTLSASATDALTPVQSAEWFVGADPGAGNGTAMTITGTGTGPYDLTADIDVTTWPDGDHTLSVRARDGLGNWGAVATTVLTVDRPQQPVHFSTSGTDAVPGVGGTADDADIYFMDGTAFSRVVDAAGGGSLGLPGGADVDGLVWISSADFYVSFAGNNTNVPGIGGVQDEDVVHFSSGTWTVYFDGTAPGLTAGTQDIDAFDIVGGTLYFSTSGNANPPGVGGAADDADIYSWNGTTFARVFDATANGVPGGANVDGLSMASLADFDVSFAGTTTNLTGLAGVQDVDVVNRSGGTWSTVFDGSAFGLAAGSGQDLDAIDVG